MIKMSKSNQFYYPHKPIASLDKLANCLGLSLSELRYLQKYSDKFFFLQSRKKKSDGSVRKIYDIRDRLKHVHEKIVQRFFKILDYPEYLQGGIQKRDHKSNARKHLNKKMIIQEDVKNFFPAISKKIIYQIWIGFFHFSHEVSDCLTELVTYRGHLVQGSKVSGFLCNLIWWRREARLASLLKEKGFVYTRFVDDVCVSSNKEINNKEKQEIIGKIYSLFSSVEARPNRRKHKIMHKGNRQSVNNLNVSKTRPTLSKEKRNNIRAAVFQCEQEFNLEKSTYKYKKKFYSVMGLVNYLKQFHARQANILLKRLNNIRPVI